MFPQGDVTPARAAPVAQRAGREGQGGGRKVTDDERLKAEGRTDQSKADLKQAGEKAKDAFRN